jgi:hypothetical protein
MTDLMNKDDVRRELERHIDSINDEINKRVDAMVIATLIKAKSEALKAAAMLYSHD